MAYDPRKERFLHTLPGSPAGIPQNPALKPPAAPLVSPQASVVAPGAPRMQPPRPFGLIHDYLNAKPQASLPKKPVGDKELP